MNSQTNVKSLFQSAVAEGALSRESYQAIQITDLGQEIAAGLGIPVDDVKASRVTLVSVMVDDSGSIRMAGNSQEVRDGHNLVLASLKDASRRNDILFHTRYLNGFVLNPYCLIDDAVEMDSGNYNPNLGTPLYDQSVVFLGTAIAKCQEFENDGVQARSVSLIITDGADMHSVKARAETVKKIVADMLRTENHIIAAMGIDDGHTDFRQVFREMGIPDQWILTPKNTPKDIRASFQLFSQRASTAAQTAGPISSVGGFGS